jgi:hypothetical protein
VKGILFVGSTKELAPGYEKGSFQGLMETELLLWPACLWREENQVRKQCLLSIYGSNKCPKYQPEGFKLCKREKYTIGGKEMIHLRRHGELSPRKRKALM